MSKIFSFFSSIGFLSLSLLTSAITITGGKLVFEEADKTAIDGAVSGGISSFWASVMMIAPYIAIFAVLGFVIAVFFGMLRFRK